MVLLTALTFLLLGRNVAPFAYSTVSRRTTPGTSITIGEPAKRHQEYLPLKHLNYANNTENTMTITDRTLPYKAPLITEIAKSDAPHYEIEPLTNDVRESIPSLDNVKEDGLPVTSIVLPKEIVLSKNVDRGSLSLLGFASASFFGLYGVAFLGLLRHTMYKMSSTLYSSIGLNTLVLFSAAFAWDNFALWGGSMGFRSITKNYGGFKFNVLKAISWPRFVLHAVLTPYLLKCSAELGRMAGIAFFQRNVVQVGAMVVASTIALLSTINVVNGGIKLDDNPRKCIKGEMTFFIHGENSFLHVLPSLLVTFVNMFIGMSVKGTGNTAMGTWMIIGSSAILSLFVPLFGAGVTKITGNLSEVILILSYVKASAMALI